MPIKKINSNKKLQAYIIGLALGDGNLSNPNGRAVRIRITCDKKYPLLIDKIKESIQKLLPENRVSIINQNGCVNVSSYSNSLETILGWKALGGSKHKQKVKIPSWIIENEIYSIECLRGLLQTDGSIYKDRNYLMVNFVSYIPSLADGVLTITNKLGFEPNIQKLKMPNGKIKHTIRISKNTDKFIKAINLWKE